ncbi:MAG: DUF362 domain-containing protein [Deltaproteobacteria bacterium]|jgi:uncharacterized protein (DUF362 family)|nr:DUF362 domain-containing protein [Deltaproteobacteria bacterium]
MHATPHLPVPAALTGCADYTHDATRTAVRVALDASGWRTGTGSRVLVKPNLLRAQSLACTHPRIVAEACAWIMEQGAKVVVADSPGFGSAPAVAEAVGLSAALRPLGLTVQACDRPVPVPLPDGRSWGVSRLALECDAILSVPKVKAHSQMRLSLAVKNLFGCVCGPRKALAHTIQGNRPDVFEDCLAALWAALPPVAGLADGVTAMHITGPSGGQPYALGCVGASACAVALDTALYGVIGVNPEAAPVWSALIRQGLPQAEPENLVYPLRRPEDFPGKNFVLPSRLLDMSFRPHRLLWSVCRRLWHTWRP